jgi:hypothetical protein
MARRFGAARAALLVLPLALGLTVVAPAAPASAQSWVYDSTYGTGEQCNLHGVAGQLNGWWSDWQCVEWHWNGERFWDLYGLE